MLFGAIPALRRRLLHTRQAGPRVQESSSQGSPVVFRLLFSLDSLAPWVCATFGVRCISFGKGGRPLDPTVRLQSKPAVSLAEHALCLIHFRRGRMYPFPLNQASVPGFLLFDLGLDSSESSFRAEQYAQLRQLHNARTTIGHTLPASSVMTKSICNALFPARPVRATDTYASK
jgi:hypothetical protein